jgi:hypothetical protein
LYLRYPTGTAQIQLHLRAPLALQKLRKALVFHLAVAQEHLLRYVEQIHLGQEDRQPQPMKRYGSDLQIVRAALGAELSVGDVPKPLRQLLR